jgi:hypothetical protein
VGPNLWTLSRDKLTLCSFPELSLLFQRFAFRNDEYLLRWKYDIWSKMDAPHILSPRVFQNAKLFCPNQDGTGIWYFNFAAPDREILEDIAFSIENSSVDQDLEMAMDRIERMPKAIQDAITHQLIPADGTIAAAIRRYLEDSKAK